MLPLEKHNFDQTEKGKHPLVYRRTSFTVLKHDGLPHYSKKAGSGLCSQLNNNNNNNNDCFLFKIKDSCCHWRSTILTKPKKGNTLSSTGVPPSQYLNTMGCHTTLKKKAGPGLCSQLNNNNNNDCFFFFFVF